MVSTIPILNNGKSNRTIWDEWEIVAIKYLQKHNYQILTTNYQIKGWEIDIITKDENQVVIIEVNIEDEINSELQKTLSLRLKKETYYIL